jgi:hypothetical protein
MPDQSHVIGAKSDPRLSGVDPDTIIPETMKVTIEEASDGVPVSNFVKEFGGLEGTVIDPRGDPHHVSLEKWRNVDQKKTRIVLKFEFKVRKGEGA